ncbi:hypothetical protein B0H10DRAFT_2435570 [Mycena sp. CBHHK59/15]|nr:hypothetical protein B0H10DRAFT_2435570 [Mycena sp. CBHHK59/15]
MSAVASPSDNIATASSPNTSTLTSDTTATASPSTTAPATTTGATNAAPATAPPKRKTARRANTAERRATHNAVERMRRESLNGRFLHRPAAPTLHPFVDVLPPVLCPVPPAPPAAG